MTRIRCSALILIVAAAFAGCGGDDEGDDNKALSYDDFGREADQICAATNDEVKPLSERLTGDPQNDAPILEELVTKQRSGVEDFKSLEPPEELKADFDEFVGISEEQLDTAEEAQTAAESGDAEAYRVALEGLEPLDEQSDLAASRLGASECIGDD